MDVLRLLCNAKLPLKIHESWLIFSSALQQQATCGAITKEHNLRSREEDYPSFWRSSMWPYSAEENEWLRPLRTEQMSAPAPESGAGRCDPILWQAQCAGELRAGAIAAFAQNLIAVPLSRRPKH